MNYNLIKKTNIQVSEISFGCMSLKEDTPQNRSLILKALDNGISLFDTADLYDKGANETLLGHALKGRRKDIVISTKVGNRWRPDGSGWDWCPRKNYIMSAVDDSLRRLQTDYIDLYLLHGGTIEDPIDEVIEAFERLADLGKIRAYGLSSIRPNVIREYASRSDIAAVMTQYSLLDRRPEEATLQLLQDNNISVLARGTVASGLLAGKRASAYLGMDEAQVNTIVKELKAALPEEYDLAKAAIRYVIDNPAATTGVIGIRTQEQLTAALDAGESAPLSAEQRNALRAAWQGNVYTEHR